MYVKLRTARTRRAVGVALCAAAASALFATWSAQATVPSKMIKVHVDQYVKSFDVVMPGVGSFCTEATNGAGWYAVTDNPHAQVGQQVEVKTWNGGCSSRFPLNLNDIQRAVPNDNLHNFWITVN